MVPIIIFAPNGPLTLKKQGEQGEEQNKDKMTWKTKMQATPKQQWLKSQNDDLCHWKQYKKQPFGGYQTTKNKNNYKEKSTKELWR